MRTNRNHHDENGCNRSHTHMPDGRVIYTADTTPHTDAHHHHHHHPSPSGTDEEQAAFFDDCAEQNLMADFLPEEQDRFNEMYDKWQIKEGMTVIEPGCGQGRLTERLAKSVGKNGMVWACDLSSKMLNRAATRLTAQGLMPQTKLFQGSILNMPLPLATADRVIMFSVYPHFADKAEVLRTAARAMNATGELWIAHLHNRQQMNEFHRNAGHVVENHILPDRDEIKATIEQAGLIFVDYEERDGWYTVHAKKR
ncbi:methyltransferase domain-containing protein [Candidatus Sumerlaeota bacterium]|nr:methyltransferase domain-containing protein [Candidatus Sumerlaeota bacterium]